MKLSMILADNAQSVGGKLFLQGGGWSITPSQGAPTGIGVVLSLSPEETAGPVELELRLVDDRGEPVTASGPEGPVPLRVQARIADVARVPAADPTDDVAVTIGVNFPPIPLAPGRYYWQAWIDGETHDDWSLQFRASTEIDASQPGV